jgi:hypothetical protein
VITAAKAAALPRVTVARHTIKTAGRRIILPPGHPRDGGRILADVQNGLGPDSDITQQDWWSIVMITGAHSIIYSTDPEADRGVLRDVLELTHVDVGGGWLIFGLPPAEVAVHPSEKNDVHELYLMCDDVEAFVAEMKRHNLTCAPVADQGWGLLTQLTLPGGGRLGIYQPRHPRPPAMAASEPSKRAGRKLE